jgi:hypothetical protein
MVNNGLSYGCYTFTCRFNEPAILPDYKGSTFRGAFGLALKKVVCALKKQECEQCVLRRRCLYTRVFETQLALETPEGLRGNAPPHPFVIQPPETGKQAFSAGELLDCNLVLLGAVNESLPYFIYAFEQIGKIGLGKKVNGRRAGFELQAVRQGDREIYSHEDQTIRTNGAGPLLNVREGERGTDAVMRVKVTLETPLRLKFNNRFNVDLPFHVLTRALIRRISSLFICYVGAEPELDYKGLLGRAEVVKTIESGLRWHNWDRYSNRQQQKMPLGGMVGEVIYEGRIGEFLPLMETGAKVHVGKNTSFGLGKLGVNLP